MIEVIYIINRGVTLFLLYCYDNYYYKPKAMTRSTLKSINFESFTLYMTDPKK